MKKQFSFLASLMLFVLLVLIACQKETVEKPVALDETPNLTEAVYYTPDISDFDVDIPEEGSAASLRSGYFTVVPAGSVDALADAIAGADPGGIIYLKAGMHTENQRVMVTKRVNIIGEDGAVLMVDSDPDGTIVNPGVHILDAPSTMIKNVDIRSNQGDGWTAILIENSPLSAVLDCQMTKFQFAVIIEQSSQVAIINNHFLQSLQFGVLANNGKSSYIAQNLFEETGVIGLWACDEWGTMENNTFEANTFGVLLCNWPEENGISLPDGTPLDAELTCTAWKIRNNQFNNSVFSGLNIRDASHWNMVENNNSYSNNTVYDIDIPDDEFLGTLFVPKAYNNTVHAAPGVTIRDCGENNTIIGGTLVDPC